MGNDTLRRYQRYTNRRPGDTKDQVATTSYFRTLSRITPYRWPYPQPDPQWGIQQKHNYILGHFPLVIYCVRRFSGPMEFSDAMQAGFRGLLKAVEKFDPRRKASFGTYAFYWIKSSILRARWNEQRLIRFPVHIEERIMTVIKHMIALEKRLRRPVTINEYEAMLPDDKRPRKTLGYMRRLTIHLDDQTLFDPVTRTVETAWANIRPVESSSCIMSPDRLNASLILGLDALKVIFRASCGDKQRVTVLLSRLGLDDKEGRPKTLEETGKLMGITHERVRQIEEQIFRRSWHPIYQRPFVEKHGRYFMGTMIRLVSIIEEMEELDATQHGAFAFRDQIEALANMARRSLIGGERSNRVLLEHCGLRENDIRELADALSEVPSEDRRMWLDWIGWNAENTPISFREQSYHLRQTYKWVSQTIRHLERTLRPRSVQTLKRSELRKVWPVLQESYPDLYQRFSELYITQTTPEEVLSAY